MDICTLTVERSLTVEESNRRSELYKTFEKELEAPVDDSRTEAILEEMKVIETQWA